MRLMVDEANLLSAFKEVGCMAVGKSVISNNNACNRTHMKLITKDVWQRGLLSKHCVKNIRYNSPVPFFI